MPLSVFASSSAAVKSELLRGFSEFASELASLPSMEMDLREFEQRFVRELFAFGRIALSLLLGQLCCQATEQDLRRRKLKPSQVKLRLDEDYWAHVKTTVGAVRVPLYAYREQTACGSVTRTPARHSVLPYHRRCRSTPLCLDWATRLAIQHPFRRAQQELRLFTHGAVSLEDTTIARHTLAVARLVERQWMYRSREEIREILRSRATRDRVNRKPVVYFSCDAHSLVRYVDETWRAQWKNVNGLRIWCEDRDTGQIIHLGGQFTWGDCHEVESVFAALASEGVLPTDGDYGQGIRAQLVWISDAMPWFNDHILKLFPTALVILDIFHVLRWMAQLGAQLFGAGSDRAQQLYAQAARVLGFRAKPNEAKPRRGHKKRPRRRRRHAHNHRQRFAGLRRRADALVKALLDVLADVQVNTEKQQKSLENVAARLCDNALRMDYAEYLRRGLQIGSGAMESMHRSGSQCRTKRPGARWSAAMSQAVFDLRMVLLVGKWEEFWSQQGLTRKLVSAFECAVET